MLSACVKINVIVIDTSVHNTRFVADFSVPFYHNNLYTLTQCELAIRSNETYNFFPKNLAGFQEIERSKHCICFYPFVSKKSVMLYL